MATLRLPRSLPPSPTNPAAPSPAALRLPTILSGMYWAQGLALHAAQYLVLGQG